ncbi:DoxX family protein [Dyadobacter arcticus]|uniref:Membrane protein YphA (DoxX/SURF4 family) n=1 Tax=Dyadobacter arcticus TaxID=1078754 RepID=A0ABX0UKP9_9BACT|nr:DoxX family protein [Dyadobacter arcticus]NIJ52255.1 putative membrane protein YphA (DoxX/SURF4 family) [Dyadobacter arcticus]
MSNKPNKIVFWMLRIVAAVILLQTLFFKFTAAEESVYIFSKLGIEPWGRIGSGVAELIAAVLILIPATTGIGAFIALGVISGALVSHLTVLGIEVKGDGGQLFIYALIVFVSCALLVFFEKDNLLFLLKGQRAGILKTESIITSSIV